VDGRERPDRLPDRTVDNVTLTAKTDFAGLVRENLLGDGGLGSLRGDCFPLDSIEPVHAELAGSPYADRLEHGVAACLTDPDPFVRAQALVFFQSHPCAAGAERLGRIVPLCHGDTRFERDIARLIDDQDVRIALLDLFRSRSP
jgi:hypothetical protein